VATLPKKSRTERVSRAALSMTFITEKGVYHKFNTVQEKNCDFSSRKEQSEGASSSRDLYSKAQREQMDNLDQANQEIDRLRKQVDKLQAELQGNTIIYLLL